MFIKMGNWVGLGYHSGRNVHKRTLLSACTLWMFLININFKKPRSWKICLATKSVLGKNIPGTQPATLWVAGVEKKNSKGPKGLFKLQWRCQDWSPKASISGRAGADQKYFRKEKSELFRSQGLYILRPRYDTHSGSYWKSLIYLVSSTVWNIC